MKKFVSVLNWCRKIVSCQLDHLKIQENKDFMFLLNATSQNSNVNNKKIIITMLLLCNDNYTNTNTSSSSSSSNSSSNSSSKSSSKSNCNGNSMSFTNLKNLNLFDSVPYYAIACQLLGQCRPKHQGLGVLIYKEQLTSTSCNKQKSSCFMDGQDLFRAWETSQGMSYFAYNLIMIYKIIIIIIKLIQYNDNDHDHDHDHENLFTIIFRICINVYKLNNNNNSNNNLFKMIDDLR